MWLSRLLGASACVGLWAAFGPFRQGDVWAYPLVLLAAVAVVDLGVSLTRPRVLPKRPRHSARDRRLFFLLVSAILFTLFRDGVDIADLSIAALFAAMGLRHIHHPFWTTADTHG